MQPNARLRLLTCQLSRCFYRVMKLSTGGRYAAGRRRPVSGRLGTVDFLLSEAKNHSRNTISYFWGKNINIYNLYRADFWYPSLILQTELKNFFSSEQFWNMWPASGRPHVLVLHRPLAGRRPMSKIIAQLTKCCQFSVWSAVWSPKFFLVYFRS